MSECGNGLGREFTSFHPEKKGFIRLILKHFNLKEYPRHFINQILYKIGRLRIKGQRLHKRDKGIDLTSTCIKVSVPTECQGKKKLSK